jgi:CRP/FNR family cyclic AMP-dependent transcriptional regulator
MTTVANGRRVTKPAKPTFDLKPFLAKAGPGRTITPFRKKDTLFAQGEPADTVLYVLNGRVKLTVVSQQGKEAVIAMLGPDDFLGEGSLAGQRLRMATATAETAGSLLTLQKKTIIRLLHEEPKFSELFVAYLLVRNVRIEEDLVDQLFNSSEKRLARILLLLSRVGTAKDEALPVPKVSQETLAEMIGTTRERVNFFMNKFRKLGFIEYNGHLSVHSSLVNVVLYDKSPEARDIG